MSSFQDHGLNLTRRHFFAQGSHALGWATLASLLGPDRQENPPAAARTAPAQMGARI